MGFLYSSPWKQYWIDKNKIDWKSENPYKTPLLVDAVSLVYNESIDDVCAISEYKDDIYYAWSNTWGEVWPNSVKIKDNANLPSVVWVKGQSFYMAYKVRDAVYCVYTENAFHTLTDPVSVVVSTDSDTPVRLVRNPTNGELMLFYLVGGDVYVKVSYDGGLSWGDPV